MQGARLLEPQLASRPRRLLLVARSAAVGVAATLVDLIVLGVLVQGLGLPPSAANLPGLLLGAATQFAGNKLYAFRDRARGRALALQGGLFALVEAGALLLNAAAFHLLGTLTPAPWLWARLLGSSLVYFGFSQPLWARIFHGEPARC